jgi:hypothetical protein
MRNENIAEMHLKTTTPEPNQAVSEDGLVSRLLPFSATNLGKTAL